MRPQKIMCGLAKLCSVTQNFAFSHSFVDIFNQITDQAHTNIWLINFEKKNISKMCGRTKFIFPKKILCSQTKLCEVTHSLLNYNSNIIQMTKSGTV